MIKIFAFIIFMASTITGFSCSCEEETVSIVPEKSYVLPDHLQITEKAIFVFLENIWEPVMTPSAKAEGFSQEQLSPLQGT